MFLPLVFLTCAFFSPDMVPQRSTQRPKVSQHSVVDEERFTRFMWPTHGHAGRSLRLQFRETDTFPIGFAQIGDTDESNGQHGTCYYVRERHGHRDGEGYSIDLRVGEVVDYYVDTDERHGRRRACYYVQDGSHGQSYGESCYVEKERHGQSYGEGYSLDLRDGEVVDCYVDSEDSRGSIFDEGSPDRYGERSTFGTSGLGGVWFNNFSYTSTSNVYNNNSMLANYNAYLSGTACNELINISCGRAHEHHESNLNMAQLVVLMVRPSWLPRVLGLMLACVLPFIIYIVLVVMNFCTWALTTSILVLLIVHSVASDVIKAFLGATRVVLLLVYSVASAVAPALLGATWAVLNFILSVMGAKYDDGGHPANSAPVDSDAREFRALFAPRVPSAPSVSMDYDDMPGLVSDSSDDDEPPPPPLSSDDDVTSTDDMPALLAVDIDTSDDDVLLPLEPALVSIDGALVAMAATDDDEPLVPTPLRSTSASESAWYEASASGMEPIGDWASTSAYVASVAKASTFSFSSLVKPALASHDEQLKACALAVKANRAKAPRASPDKLRQAALDYEAEAALHGALRGCTVADYAEMRQAELGAALVDEAASAEELRLEALRVHMSNEQLHFEQEQALASYRAAHDELMGNKPAQPVQSDESSESDDGASESDESVSSSSSEEAPTPRSLSCLIFTVVFTVLVVFVGSWCLLSASTAPLVLGLKADAHAASPTAWHLRSDSLSGSHANCHTLRSAYSQPLLASLLPPIAPPPQPPPSHELHPAPPSLTPLASPQPGFSSQLELAPPLTSPLPSPAVLPSLFGGSLLQPLASSLPSLAARTAEPPPLASPQSPCSSALASPQPGLSSQLELALPLASPLPSLASPQLSCSARSQPPLGARASRHLVAKANLAKAALASTYELRQAALDYEATTTLHDALRDCIVADFAEKRLAEIDAALADKAASAEELRLEALRVQMSSGQLHFEQEQALASYRVAHDELMLGREPAQPVQSANDDSSDDSASESGESVRSSSSVEAPTLRSLSCLIFTVVFTVLIVLLGSWCLLPTAASLFASAASSVRAPLSELGGGTTWALHAQTGNLIASDDVMIVDCGATAATRCYAVGLAAARRCIAHLAATRCFATRVAATRCYTARPPPRLRLGIYGAASSRAHAPPCLRLGIYGAARPPAHAPSRLRLCIYGAARHRAHAPPRLRLGIYGAARSPAHAPPRLSYVATATVL